MTGDGHPASPAELDRLDALIEAWLAGELEENPAVDAVERDVESGERRWFVRLLGEQKSVFSVWFCLRQRTLHVESYVMPAPEENAEELYAHLLRRNLKLYGLQFAIGDEDAIYLVGQIPTASVCAEELDRLLGTAYASVEQFFRPAMRIGFRSRFHG